MELLLKHGADTGARDNVGPGPWGDEMLRGTAMNRGRKPVDCARTDKIRALLRKAEEAPACLGCDVSFTP